VPVRREKPTNPRSAKKSFAAWRINEMNHNTLSSPEIFDSAAISGTRSSFTVVAGFFCNQASDLDR
jgi:hypothetical protein